MPTPICRPHPRRRRRPVAAPAAHLLIGSSPRFPHGSPTAACIWTPFGAAEVSEMIDGAVVNAFHDQVTASLDVITDGEQTQLDFNLSFYGYLTGIAEEKSPRIFRPARPATSGANTPSWTPSPHRTGWSAEFQRLRRPPPEPTLKANIPGPYARRPPDPNAIIPTATSSPKRCCPSSARTHRAGGSGLRRDHRGRAVHELLCHHRKTRGVCGHLQPHRRGGGQMSPLHPSLLQQLVRRGNAPVCPMDYTFLNMHVDEIHVEMAASSPKSRSSAPSPNSGT
ncbi:MAG: hypothetical protein R2838_26500 [Caldilineaceae bacterium]